MFCCYSWETCPFLTRNGEEEVWGGQGEEKRGESAAGREQRAFLVLRLHLKRKGLVSMAHPRKTNFMTFCGRERKVGEQK